MQDPGWLGSEFASQSKSASGLEAKLLLYRELDDGYGVHFHDVFTDQDREDPYLIQAMGARVSRFTPTQRAEAKSFITDHGLSTGSWRQGGMRDLFCNDTIKRYRDLKEGELGERFIASIPSATSFWDHLLLKRVLMDTLECPRLRSAIFTPSELCGLASHFVATDPALAFDEFCTPEQLQLYRQSAEQFLGIQKPERLTGVTFGWEDSTGEWHLYGGLSTVNLLRCHSLDIPRIFGEINFETAAWLLPRIWQQTYLCRVVAEPRVAALPSYEGSAYIHPVRTLDVTVCKWMRSLEGVYGEFNKHKAPILLGAAQIRKENEHG